jgi:hypothetical protein
MKTNDTPWVDNIIINAPRDVLDAVTVLLRKQRDLYEAELAKSDAENERLKQHINYLAKRVNEKVAENEYLQRMLLEMKICKECHLCHIHHDGIVMDVELKIEEDELFGGAR